MVKSDRLVFRVHAIQRMFQRQISEDDVKHVLVTGQVIEDYPEDVRGHSCLMLGRGVEDRPVHVVCTPTRDYLAVITAYLPSAEQWASDWRTRRKE